MELVVAAIVILIVALVVITIFGGSITPIGGMTSAQSICKTQCISSCQMSNGASIPLTWNLETVRDTKSTTGKLVSCSSFYQGTTCDVCPEWKTGQSGGGAGSGGRVACTNYKTKITCTTNSCTWTGSDDSGSCS